MVQKPTSVPGKKITRLVCHTCRDVELSRWWLGGASIELSLSDVDQFDKDTKTKFKRAIFEAAECAAPGGEEGTVAESLVIINSLSNTSSYRGAEAVHAIRVDFYVDAEYEYEVHAMKAKLSFERMRTALAKEGLEALPPRTVSTQKKRKESTFPSELKKGVKSACADDPEAYRHFVSICTGFARDTIISRKQV